MLEKSETKKKALRGHWLIYPKFQLGLIGVNALVMAGAMALVAYQFHRSMQKLKEMGRVAGLTEGHAYFRFLDLQSTTISSYIGIAFVVAFCLSLVLTLVFSHRLAGPIVRLKGFFRAISEGKEPVQYSVKFRQGDFFGDLPPLVNSAINKMRGSR
ncbi:hypothetical protein WDW37_07825 [Bdellovibrionota bacterium FG-1]